MMDLKEIIKWFIPCFHLLTVKKRKMVPRLTFVCLFLFFHSCAGMAAKVNSEIGLSENNVGITKNVGVSFKDNSYYNQSEVITDRKIKKEEPRSTSGVGRTFGRPFKKMIGALMPLIFQIGAASTWAVVAALVGVKTLVVTLIILKILLIAGAAKIGAIFASKGHHKSPEWEQPHQKEIHLHIHNGQHGHEHHEEHVPYSPWSREGASTPEVKNVNIMYDPYRGGPQTISTPYGNYVKIDPGTLTR